MGVRRRKFIFHYQAKEDWRKVECKVDETVVPVEGKVLYYKTTY